MNEVIAVTWSADQVEIRQLPSEGVWQPHVPPIRTIELNRPTRIDRLTQLDSGGGFHQALLHLFADIEISLPVWLLLPNEWVQSFRVDNPNLQTDEMQRAHLLWEAQQRLSEDISRFMVYLPDDLTQPKSVIHMIRSDILNLYINESKKAGVEVAGIWVEPEWGKDYNFEIPSDFRDAIPADLIDIAPARPPVTVPNWVSIAVGVVALALAGYIWMIPTGERPRHKAASVQKQHEATATKESKEAGAVGQSETARQHGSPSSPLNQLIESLPAGAKIEFAVISPVDCKAEISGLGNVQDWLKKLKRQTVFKSARIIKSYNVKGRSVSAFRLTRPGWNSKAIDRNVDNWKSMASAQGMKARGRSAAGGYKSALKLVNAVWLKPSGFEKIYLAPNKGQWVVTVQ